MKIFGRLFGYILAVTILAVPFAAFVERENLQDWWLLRGYTPPRAVSQLASQDTMTPSATHIFYVNHPEVIDNALAFRAQCTATEQTIVLGCYHSDQRGIYIYDVKDGRLAGVEQVTAAHEMLHAAYDRLDPAEKQRINSLLENFYRTQVKDQRLIGTINSYKKTEPHDVVNEMHSIFGTEVASLPKDLEDYYKQYFSNRLAVVAFSSNYKNEFTKRVDQIETDDAKLKELKSQIDAEETSLSLQLADLQANRAKLDGLRSSGQITAYNSEVPVYNAKVNSYNSNIYKLQSDIKAYNELVEARNALASEVRQLDRALSTDLTAEPPQ